MRWLLIALFSGVFASMTWITVAASMQQNISEAGRELWPHLWFRATLMDAYFGFLCFFLWVAYKETHWLVRGLWFVLIMLLGNFAMSSYLLWKLLHLKDFSWESLLLRQSTTHQ